MNTWWIRIILMLMIVEVDREYDSKRMNETMSGRLWMNIKS